MQAPTTPDGGKESLEHVIAVAGNEKNVMADALLALLVNLLVNSALMAPARRNVVCQKDISIDDQLDSQSCIEVTEEAVPGVSTVPRLTIQSGLLRGPQPAQEIASQYVSAEVSAAPVRLMSQTSQLLKNYFTLTHSWFPVVSKSSILRTSFTLDHIPGTVETKSPASGDHAALWATLSYSITQYGVETGIEHTRAMSLAEKYSTEAQNLIPFELERCELGHIQALLLLALVDMNMQAWEPAWLLIGQAIRMAFTIGLGSSSDIRRYDKPEQGKATLFGCYVLDSLLSYRLLKCPRMSPIDLAQVGLLEEDGQEDWTSGVKSPSPREPLLAIGCFNHLVQLANILNRLAPKLLMGHNGETVARQLLMDLEQWDANLPIGCRLMGPENMYLERNSSTLPHQTYLSLAYIATLLWSYSRLIPGEKGLHPWLQPATQGAKRLLCRGLSMITQHLENFPKSGIPPIFEFSLHTIAEKAFSLCDTANPSDTSLFVEWIETFMQKVILLVPTWSPHASLMSTTESCQKSVGSSTGQISAFSSNIDHPNLSRESSLIMEPRGDFIDVLPKPHGGCMSPTACTESLIDAHLLTIKTAAIDRPDILTLQPPVQQVITLNMAALQSEPASISLQGLIKPQLRKTGIFTPNVMSAGNDPGIEPSTIIDDGMADNHDCKEYPDAFLGDLAYPNAIGWSKSRESGIDDFESLGNSTFHESSHSQDSSFELQNGFLTLNFTILNPIRRGVVAAGIAQVSERDLNTYHPRSASMPTWNAPSSFKFI
ncbi:hypothetical protein PENANT_c004G05820 [Penicillium antarcticum]|uniref:Xylanolytic transcriptional activator regulatory domain-containing protein n=1 Tax=Penicillium antarcticum TaxID=416450 RepID=A0A1V6QGP8_9EURO|nr:hypothetical protein PENANT_c004G05820 [Penicillium antarcticum]